MASNTIAHVTVAGPIQLAYELVQQGGLVQLRLLGPASQQLMVEASSDLIHWIPRYTNSSSTLPLDFLDAPSTDYQQRFYRALPWP